MFFEGNCPFIPSEQVNAPDVWRAYQDVYRLRRDCLDAAVRLHTRDGAPALDAAHVLADAKAFAEFVFASDGAKDA